MKIITRQDKDFRQHFNYICEVMPAMRSIYMQVYKIEYHPNGLLFLDKEGNKLSSISKATFLNEENEFKKIWKPETHHLL